MNGYLPLPVDEYVPGAALFKDNPDSVTLSHVAGEWKGPDGSMAEAMLQSSYDGAALVYARNQALAYLDTADPVGHANIITFTTNGTQISFFAHYAAPGEDGQVEYHQFPIHLTDLISSHQKFKDGRKHLRNVQDNAKHLSCALRDRLKENYK